MNTDAPDHPRVTVNPRVTVTYALGRPARLDLESFARVTGTHRAQEALHDAQTKALRFGHTEVDGEHLLCTGRARCAAS